ncbi:MAG: transglycosylase SLT domain-containing protein [Nitrosomonadaceae bacterium]|nr:transglycosylase SLT domain-containing protein [Nitrosomonadaceae bacterium]
MKKFLPGLLLLVLTGTAVASQDADFIAARQAFQAGNSARLETYARRLQGHVLEPYAAYYQLSLQLGNIDANAVKKFLSHNQGSFLADRLQGEWLKTLGKKQQWELFTAEYPALINKDAELICYSLQQRLAASDGAALTEARPLWFSTHDLPKNCTPLFEALTAARLLTVEDVWTRLRLTLEAGNVSVAKHINRYLPSDQALNASKLDVATSNPLRYLDKQRHEIKTRADREVALYALLRLLRSGPDQAFAYWPKVRERLDPAEQSYFLGHLASQAARRLDPRALGWFRQAAATHPAPPLSDTQLAWQTRAALRAGDWKTVLRSIETMSAAEQQAGVWRYWKARALKTKGRITEANALLAPLSSEHNFYGQLAEEEMGVVIGIPDEPYKAGAQEIAAMQQLPGIQRALALYRLNLRAEGTREWNWSIRGFDDRRLLAAAEVARRNGVYDRAISTADRTVQLHDFSLRFLTPHREALQNHLQQQQLDEAWVYGLIRQESRFITDARSSAGATGLMQLMPATAKWVAKKMSIKNYHHALANEVNTNLALGTYYLKHVLTTLDNQPLLASAAYNAGPGRARQWRDARPLEGAIYAETIPFSETRDYVKKVLSNSMYYASTLGHRLQTLQQRLGTVAPKSTTNGLSEEEK